MRKELNNQAIADKINKDIENGMYVNFDKLKNRLEKIAHNLVLQAYLSNSEGLSNRELTVLEENEYI